MSLCLKFLKKDLRIWLSGIVPLGSGHSNKQKTKPNQKRAIYTAKCQGSGNLTVSLTYYMINIKYKRLEQIFDYSISELYYMTILWTLIRNFITIKIGDRKRSWYQFKVMQIKTLRMAAVLLVQGRGGLDNLVLQLEMKKQICHGILLFLLPENFWKDW